MYTTKEKEGECGVSERKKKVALNHTLERTQPSYRVVRITCTNCFTLCVP